MSAFGRKSGVGAMAAGARPSFGVARPMKGGDAPKSGSAPMPGGGDQFPPLPPSDAVVDPLGKNADALSRLAERANGVSEGNYEAQGFEASVHKIKEQCFRACSSGSIPKPPPR